MPNETNFETREIIAVIVLAKLRGISFGKIRTTKLYKGYLLVVSTHVYSYIYKSGKIDTRMTRSIDTLKYIIDMEAIKWDS